MCTLVVWNKNEGQEHTHSPSFNCRENNALTIIKNLGNYKLDIFICKSLQDTI